MLPRSTALAIAAICLACAAPAWGSGHGHGHKRRSGGLLGRLRRTSSQQTLATEAKENARINSAVGAVLSAVSQKDVGSGKDVHTAPTGKR
jgi:hypothetical protein